MGDLIPKVSPLQYCSMPWAIDYFFLALFPHGTLPVLCLGLSAAGFLQCDPGSLMGFGPLNKSLIMCKIALALSACLGIVIS